MGDYYTGSGLGFQHLGRVGDSSGAMTPPVSPQEVGPVGFVRGPVSPLGKLMALAGTLSIPLLAYHGYKRNDSIGWAFAWALGSIAWPIMVPVAFAQGLGKPKRSSPTPNRRRRSSRRPALASSNRRRRSTRRRTSRRSAS